MSRDMHPIGEPDPVNRREGEIQGPQVHLPEIRKPPKRKDEDELPLPPDGNPFVRVPGAWNKIAVEADIN